MSAKFIVGFLVSGALFSGCVSSELDVESESAEITANEQTSDEATSLVPDPEVTCTLKHPFAWYGRPTVQGLPICRSSDTTYTETIPNGGRRYYYGINPPTVPSAAGQAIVDCVNGRLVTRTTCSFAIPL